MRSFIVSAALIVATASAALPAVDSEALQASIQTENLLAKAQHLEDIAYATPGRNRGMGSLGHNETVAYLVEYVY